MVSIGKIKIGRSTKRNHLNMQHDCETTSSFGVVQPTICKLIIPNSKISISSKSFTRLAPLPCPTFGRIKVNMSNRFIPISEVFEAYDYFQKQQQLDTAIRSYIPQEFDNVDMSLVRILLTSMLYPDTEWLNNCESINDYINRIPFRISFWLPRWAVDSSYYHELFVSSTLAHDSAFMAKATEMVNLCNDSCWFPATHIIGTSHSIGEIANKYIAKTICSFLQNNLSLPNDLLSLTNLPFSNFYNYSNNEPINPILPSFFSIVESGHDYGVLPIETGFDWMGAFLADGNRKEVEMFHQANDYEKSLLFPMSLDNADFIFQHDISNYTLIGPNDSWNSDDFSIQPKIIVSLHLTPFGKRLIGKVFNPLKTPLLASLEQKLELPKFFAFYKSYFDKYNPGRLKSWKQTNCYRLIHQYYDNGIILNSQIINNYNSNDIRYIKSFMDFLFELGNMYSTFPVDNITVATEYPLLEQPQSNNEIDLQVGPSENITGDTGDNANQYGSLSDSIEKTGGLGVKFLERVYYLANKNSVFGSRVRDYMIGHNMGLPPSERLKISDESYYLNISDIVGTVNNDSTILGEYAGKGQGGNQGKRYIYENDELGYFIQLLDIMPFGGYVQGAEKPHINRYDVYQSELDSLGKEPLLISEVMGRNYIPNQVYVNGNNVYGFVPRYFSEKVINNNSAGDFSLRSTQSQFLPYTLNRLFDNGVVFRNALDPSFDLSYTLPFTSHDEELRFVGKFEAFGNFDRIFYDTYGLTDNFIVHIIQDLHVYSPCKPVSESFDTYDKDLHDSSIDVSPI